MYMEQFFIGEVKAGDVCETIEEKLHKSWNTSKVKNKYI